VLPATQKTVALYTAWQMARGTAALLAPSSFQPYLSERHQHIAHDVLRRKLPAAHQGAVAHCDTEHCVELVRSPCFLVMGFATLMRPRSSVPLARSEVRRTHSEVVVRPCENKGGSIKPVLPARPPPPPLQSAEALPYCRRRLLRRSSARTVRPPRRARRCLRPPPPPRRACRLLPQLLRARRSPSRCPPT